MLNTGSGDNPVATKQFPVAASLGKSKETTSHQASLQKKILFHFLLHSWRWTSGHSHRTVAFQESSETLLAASLTWVTYG